MSSLTLADQATARFRDLAEQQYGRLLNRLSSGHGAALVNAALAFVEQSIPSRSAQTAAPQDPFTSARAVWAGLQQLADHLALKISPKPEDRKELGEATAANEAVKVLESPEDRVWPLTMYLGLPHSETARITNLALPDVERAARRAAQRMQMAKEVEGALIRELKSLHTQVWKVAYGPIPAPFAALVRDAVLTRVVGDEARHSASRRYYFLAFARYYRIYRIAIDEGVTGSDGQSKQLIRVAKDELQKLRGAAAARPEIKWAAGFVREGEPFADDWFALMRDAFLPAATVADMVGESAGHVEDTVGRYEAAIGEWIAQHPDIRF